MSKPKPNFTGVWKFNAAKSALQIPAPDSAIFVIAHREPELQLARTHTVGAHSDTFSITLATDGAEVRRTQDDLEVHACLRWGNETLVCETTLARAGSRAMNVVRYRMGEEGRTLIADECFRSEGHSHDNTWVFDKQ